MYSWEELKHEKEMITVIGAGGKSTCIRYLTEKYRDLGKKVLVTTTTHMRLPKTGVCLTGSVEEIEERLEAEGYAAAGIPVCDHGIEKIKALPLPVLEQVMKHADVVLCEGDGSRGLPIKVPAAHEPVILPWTTRILVVEGLSGIGRSLREACHRAELAAEILNCGESHPITPEELAVLVKEGYLTYLNREWSGRNVTVILNQGDTAELRKQAVRCRSFIKEVPVVIASLAAGKTYDSI